MTQLDTFDQRYYDYPEEDDEDGENYDECFVERGVGTCGWCEEKKENHQIRGTRETQEPDWGYDGDYESLENLRSDRRGFDNRKNVCWEDRNSPDNLSKPTRIPGVRKSPEVLCPHCNYYVRTKPENGPRWYIALLSTVLLPCW